jgi:hypothetical protein
MSFLNSFFLFCFLFPVSCFLFPVSCSVLPETMEDRKVARKKRAEASHSSLSGLSGHSLYDICKTFGIKSNIDA